MADQIKYVTAADGVRIAFFSDGAGPPLVLVPNPLMSLIFDREEKRPWYDALAARYRIVMFDVRGSGASARGPSALTVEAALLDLEAVVAAELPSRFSIMSFSDGTPIALAYAARNPECVQALLTYNGWGRAEDSGSPSAVAAETALRPGDPRLYTELLSQMTYDFHGGERSTALAAQLRRSSSPELLRSTMADLYTWDVRPLLSSVRCPVLVVQNRAGSFPESGAGQRLASALPDGRLVRMEGVGRPSPEEVLAFFDEHTPGHREAVQTTLSAREVEVLRLVAEGYSNKQVAFQLGITLNTVLRHVSNIFAKTESHNRVEAAAAARRLRLVD